MIGELGLEQEVGAAAFGDQVLAANGVKRLIMFALKMLKTAPILVILLFPFRKMFLKFFAEYGEMTLLVYYFKPQYYLKTGRMLGKAIFETFKDERLSRIATYIWEYDDRYRYNFQLVFGLLNRKEFEKNPKKELRRILDELIKRENHKSDGAKRFMIEKWLLVKRATYLLPMKNVIKCIGSMDWEVMKLDKDDLHFAQQMQEFNYR